MVRVTVRVKVRSHETPDTDPNRAGVNLKS